jgi:hypothetical protein
MPTIVIALLCSVPLVLVIWDELRGRDSSDDAS